MRFALALLLAAGWAEAGQKLLVISVDGLDWRYLRDRDQLGLKIPHMRRLLAEGESADGVMGVVPTVTWPSHTTLITGVTPDEHGIRGNRRPASEGGDYYWTVDLLKTKTLWHRTRAAGLKSAAITWPVTVNAEIDYNLPEYFQRRNGGSMDLDSIEKKATPGLVAEIARRFPSFPHEWMDDRSRTLATVFLIKEKRPDLILLHLVDHDAEAHERGPFTREANAAVEYTDELIGQMLQAAGRDYVVALVSDHGFERTDRIVEVPPSLQEAGVRVTPFLLLAPNEEAARRVRQFQQAGREIPREELDRLQPGNKLAAAFEPAPHATYVNTKERGNHGYWPGRKDYRATFVLWGPGVKRRNGPEISMLQIAGRFAAILGLR